MTTISHLPHRALIRLAGPDWASFLKGLCTAHIDRINDEVARGVFYRLHYGAFLRPQGKMIADCLIHAVAADEIWLDVPLSARDELLAKLNMYRLRAKVTVEALEHPVFAAFGGDMPQGMMTDPRSAIIGASFGFAYGERQADAIHDDWVDFRYAQGLGDAGYDFGMDELYAIDANLDLLDAIDFHKGCYVGQELTSRMKRRGQIKNRILPLKSDGNAAKGAEILLGERKVGEILASAHGRALGLMRLDRLNTLNLTSDGIEMTASVPDWIAPHVTLGDTAP